MTRAACCRSRQCLLWTRTQSAATNCVVIARDPKISGTQPTIRRLEDAAINRIAAGEVVERPASAVKELVENAIDAGARQISVVVAEGGKRLIRVEDDGCGIAEDQLQLALARHATSKIDGSDLLNIHTLGFRGEALASLAAVGRLSVTSRPKGCDAAVIEAAAGTVEPVRPAASGLGTTVELRDLFFATPARLKFLRSERGEMRAVTDVVKRQAMSEPYAGFELLVEHSDASRKVFAVHAETGDPVQALSGRIQAILGKDFIENAVSVDAKRDGLHMTGFAALPTFSRGSAVHQHFFVNGRPVRDRLLIGALRAAYSDVLRRDRHAAAAIFIDCEPTLVDVNVHPSKSEVRFREPGVARGLVVSGLRHALAEAGHRSSSTIGTDVLGAFRAPPGEARVYQMDHRPGRGRAQVVEQEPQGDGGFLQDMDGVPAGRVEPVDAEDERLDFPLGAARAQFHENFILAQTRDGIILVDAHAAHERLVYERLKAQLAESGVARQALLVPEIVELGEMAAEILEHAEDLQALGLAIEPFGQGAVAVQETPAILGQVDASRLLKDIADELEAGGSCGTLRARVDAVLSRIACHGSVRTGRLMRAEEMNALLREMEATPNSGQCNHGRPTYVELKMHDVERLFGRR